jgi:hypothetical protein
MLLHASVILAEFLAWVVPLRLCQITGADCPEGFLLKTKYRSLHVLRLQCMHALESERARSVLILTHFLVAHRKDNTTVCVLFRPESLFKYFL